MNEKLSRRDFLKLAGITSAGLALSACGVKATDLPTATSIPPTNTSLPTETLTPTLTSTPTLPLEQLPQTKQALEEFVQAFQAVGVDISTDQLIQKGLEIRNDIAFVHVENSAQLEGDYPLMIKMDDKWENIGLKNVSPMLIGTSTIWDLLNTDKRELDDIRKVFVEIFKKDFDAYTLTFNWAQVQENSTSFDFQIVDWQLKQLKKLGLYDSAKANLRAHPLLWSWTGSVPKWLTDGNYTKEQVIDFMKTYITKVVNKYKGEITQWIVVNEPAGNTGSWGRKDFLYETIGSEYIDIAFQAAREADPSAILIFNDTDNHTPTGNTTSNTRSVANRLKEKGLVDMVGTQMHIDASKSFDKEKIIETQISYGVPVYVTELDVDLSGVTGTEQERFLLQAQIYQQVAQACIMSGVCKSITFWESPGDKFNWLENYQNKPNAEATLYTDTLEKKAAYYLFSQGLLK